MKEKCAGERREKKKQGEEISTNVREHKRGEWKRVGEERKEKKMENNSFYNNLLN